jgi:hypothetical protein
LVFDVNTDYFERNGGYEFAKKFYEEAYRIAVKEVGEEYILSAVLHADERNKALSEQYGRDVYHYHLHVVYVPVVMKDVLWSKRTKDKSLIGTVKERIPQVSHSKKWPIRVPTEREGKVVTVNSYSLLQDRYFEQMRAAGFEGFERGEVGSTREHLSVTEYKVQQEEQRLAELTAAAAEQQKALDALETRAEKKEKQIEKLDAKISVREKVKATIAEIDAMGHSIPLVPGTHFTVDDTAKLKKWAKKSLTMQEQLNQSKKRQDELDKQLWRCRP